MKSSITQIERRFDIPSSLIGVIDGSFEMGARTRLVSLSGLVLYRGVSNRSPRRQPAGYRLRELLWCQVPSSQADWGRMLGHGSRLLPHGAASLLPGNVSSQMSSYPQQSALAHLTR